MYAIQVGNRQVAALNAIQADPGVEYAGCTEIDAAGSRRRPGHAVEVHQTARLGNLCAARLIKGPMRHQPGIRDRAAPADESSRQNP